jgi:hypothetical protein
VKDMIEYIATLWMSPQQMPDVDDSQLETKAQSARRAVAAEMSAIVDALSDIVVARAMAMAAAESWARALAMAAVDWRLTGGAGFEIAKIAVAQPTPTDEPSVPSVPTEAVEASPSFPVSEDSRSGSML